MKDFRPSASKQFVADLKERDQLMSVFLASDKTLLVDRNGKKYLSLSLSDRSGKLNARMWERVEILSEQFQNGDFVKVKGHVQLFQNRRQIVLHDICLAQPEDYQVKDFVASDRVEPERMYNELCRLVCETQNPFVRQLLENTIKDPEIRQKLMQSPAAKSIHHAYLGGLLEHILSITNMMKFLAEHYRPLLDRDLLVFGAIYHDIGKLWELQLADGIQYTDRGRLVGHMTIACELIDEKAAEIERFPSELKDVLKHIVLSHHGKLEYGSPKRPKFPEALVVAMIDDLDSKLNTIFQFMESELEGGERWSRYHTGFDRYFYLSHFRERIEAQRESRED